MYKRILVAIDGSDTGSIAFESAMQLAKAASADLFAVYVVEYPKLYMADTGYDLTPIYDALASEGDRIAKEANERLKERGIGGEAQVVNNFLTGKTTAEQIQNSADALHVDLVVLGTHGRSGFKRLMLGSVAEAFVRISTRPVLLVPQKKADAPSKAA